MFQLVKKRIKDQRGLTLIELLAVIVILGIISAIAIPSILGLIDNSKKDAHVANAQQMVNAAKMAITTDANLQKVGTTIPQGQSTPTPIVTYLTLDYLETNNFLETVKDPDGSTTSYVKNVTPTDATSEKSNASYVKIVDGKVVSVKLVNSTRGVQNADKTPVDVDKLARGAVN